jgi:hypothetical protein
LPFTRAKPVGLKHETVFSMPQGHRLDRT